LFPKSAKECGTNPNKLYLGPNSMKVWEIKLLVEEQALSEFSIIEVDLVGKLLDTEFSNNNNPLTKVPIKPESESGSNTTCQLRLSGL